MSELSVGEAMSAKREFDKLMAATPAAEKPQLYLDGIDDPYYGPGLEAGLLLDELHAGLGELAIQKEQAPKEESDDAEVDIVKDLLREIENDEPDDFELQEIIARDIEQIHSALDRYNTARGRINGKATNKQQQGLDRTLRSELPSRYLDEVAASPLRAKALLESIACKEGIRVSSRNDVDSYVIDRLTDAVRKQVHQQSPDDIAAWIKVSAAPSMSRERLEKLYAGEFFKSTNVSNVESVLTNYERFMSGVLRVIEMPETATYAMGIAHFETDILPMNGRYHHMLSHGALARVDRPDLIRRRFGLVRVDTALAAQLHTETTPIPTEQGAEIGAPGSVSLKVARNLLRGNLHSRVQVSQVLESLNYIDVETYQRRHELLAKIQEHLQTVYDDPTIVFEQIFGQAQNGGIQPSGTDVLRMFAESMTDNDADRAFATEIFHGESALQEESTHYLSDMGANSLMRPMTGKHYVADSATTATTAHMTPILISRVAEEFADDPEAAELIANMAGGTDKLVNEVKVSLGNGFCVGLLVDKEVAEAFEDTTNDERLQWLAPYVDASLVDEAINKLSQPRGANRSYEVVGGANSSSMYVVRRETKAETQQIHPIDGLLDHFEDVTEELPVEEAQALVEESVFVVREQRRRFMNRRGIQVHFNLPGDDKLRLAFRKHPRNPQAFIGSLAQGNTSATFLLDPSLKVQLGDKRVNNRDNLTRFNAVCSAIIALFATQETVDTEEGVIGDGKSSVTARIAHLRLLRDNESYRYGAWSNCLEAEGEDLEVLSARRAEKLGTTRKSTYVKAVESDDPNLPPLLIYLS